MAAREAVAVAVAGLVAVGSLAVMAVPKEGAAAAAGSTAAERALAAAVDGTCAVRGAEQPRGASAGVVGEEAARRSRPSLLSRAMAR